MLTKERILPWCLFTSIVQPFERMLWALFSPKLSVVYLQGVHWPFIRPEWPELKTQGQVLKSGDKQERPSLLLRCKAQVTTWHLPEGFRVSIPLLPLTTFTLWSLHHLGVFIGFNVLLTMLAGAFFLIMRGGKFQIRHVQEKPETVTKAVSKAATSRDIYHDTT